MTFSILETWKFRDDAMLNKQRQQSARTENQLEPTNRQHRAQFTEKPST